MSTCEELEDACSAITDDHGLRKELSDWTVSELRAASVAPFIQARPETGETAKEVVHSAREETRILRARARDTTESDQGRKCLVLCRTGGAKDLVGQFRKW